MPLSVMNYNRNLVRVNKHLNDKTNSTFRANLESYIKLLCYTLFINSFCVTMSSHHKHLTVGAFSAF